MEHPSDAYGGAGASRAVYHVVGRVLSGPDHVIFNSQLRDHIGNYDTVREEPWFGIQVVPERASWADGPVFETETNDSLIVIDMRFELHLRNHSAAHINDA
jgi:hypothetical protein